MAGIGIIANPHSKLNKRYPQRQHLLSYIAGESGHFKVTNNLEELKQVTREFHRREISILAINGGDGTISRTLSALLETYRQTPKLLPKIVLLRGGTINMLADNLGISGRPEQILYRLIEAHSLGLELPEQSFASLQIANNYGFIFASGASARFLKEFYKNKTNSLGSVFLTIRVMVSALVQGPLFRRIVGRECLTITTDEGSSFRHGTLSLLCATVPYAPFKRRLFPQAMHDRQRLHLVSVAHSPEELVGRFMPNYILFPDSFRTGKLQLAARTLRVSSARPIPYTLDGELYESEGNEVALSCGPQLTFVVV